MLFSGKGGEHQGLVPGALLGGGFGHHAGAFEGRGDPARVIVSAGGGRGIGWDGEVERIHMPAHQDATFGEPGQGSDNLDGGRRLGDAAPLGKGVGHELDLDAGQGCELRGEPGTGVGAERAEGVARRVGGEVPDCGFETVGVHGLDEGLGALHGRMVAYPTQAGQNRGMKVVFGSDHAGFELRRHLADGLAAKGHEVEEVGASSLDSFDYPLASDEVAARVLDGRADFGVLVCGTGIGVSIRANRYPGVRAALCTSVEMARLAREHNYANVLCLGARILSQEDAGSVMDAFFEAAEERGERHERRVSLLDGNVVY